VMDFFLAGVYGYSYVDLYCCRGISKNVLRPCPASGNNQRE
jgi:hypothetical protein